MHTPAASVQNGSEKMKLEDKIVTLSLHTIAARQSKDDIKETGVENCEVDDG